MNDELDRADRISQELKALRQELKECRRSAVVHPRRVIEAMLQRRGIKSIKYRDPATIVLPEGCDAATAEFFYTLMGKYSFRIFLRDLLLCRHKLDMRRLTRYCSQETAQHYLSLLQEHQILFQLGPQCYHFVSEKICNFGDTLEWFVAELMQREFDCPSVWGIRFKDSESGGDYDVISCVEGRLVYIEVKSSPPKHIDLSEVHAFMNRVMSLRPDAAIFLEDTHLRMKDKLALIFEEELQSRYGSQASETMPVRRLHDEIFAIGTRIFLSNSKPDFSANLTVCLKTFLTKEL